MGIVYKVWKDPYALGQTKQITCLLKSTYIPTVELLGQLTHVMCWTSGNKIANFHSEQPTLFPVFDKPRNCTSSQTHPLCPHLSFL